MEVTVPPLTVLHPDHRLFSAELCSNTCRRTTGRTIAQLGFLQYSHAEATLCQSNGDKRASCTTTNDDDVLGGRGKSHNRSFSLMHWHLPFAGVVCILPLEGRQEHCPFTTRL